MAPAGSSWAGSPQECSGISLRAGARSTSVAVSKTVPPEVCTSTGRRPAADGPISATAAPAGSVADTSVRRASHTRAEQPSWTA